jgi:hypothetical protein
MDESKTSAPDKHQPHVFEPSPEVPIVNPRIGSMPQLGAPAATIGPAGRPNCALCGAPEDARIHIEGKAEADAESPDWG